MPRIEHLPRTPMPTRRDGESLGAFYHRMNEWESIMRDECKRDARAIDSALSRPRISANRVRTVQATLDLESIHDIAQRNLVLLRLLRRVR